jgi:hypothetical protein
LDAVGNKRFFDKVVRPRESSVDVHKSWKNVLSLSLNELGKLKGDAVPEAEDLYAPHSLSLSLFAAHHAATLTLFEVSLILNSIACLVCFAHIDSSFDQPSELSSFSVSLCLCLSLSLCLSVSLSVCLCLSVFSLVFWHVDSGMYGALEQFDGAVEAIRVKTERPLRKFEQRVTFHETTSDDPVLQVGCCVLEALTIMSLSSRSFTTPVS